MKSFSSLKLALWQYGAAVVVLYAPLLGCHSENRGVDDATEGIQ